MRHQNNQSSRSRPGQSSPSHRSSSTGHGHRPSHNPEGHNQYSHMRAGSGREGQFEGPQSSTAFHGQQGQYGSEQHDYSPRQNYGSPQNFDAQARHRSQSGRHQQRPYRPSPNSQRSHRDEQRDEQRDFQDPSRSYGSQDYGSVSFHGSDQGYDSNAYDRIESYGPNHRHRDGYESDFADQVRQEANGRQSHYGDSNRGPHGPFSDREQTQMGRYQRNPSFESDHTDGHAFDRGQHDDRSDRGYGGPQFFDRNQFGREDYDREPQSNHYDRGQQRQQGQRGHQGQQGQRWSNQDESRDGTMDRASQRFSGSGRGDGRY